MRSLIWAAALTMGGSILAAGGGDVAAEPATDARIEAAAGNSITIRRAEDGVRITFTGALQSADTVAGPWANVPGAASPHEESAASERRFFRARGPDSVFDSSSTAELTLQGPLQAHFELAFAGLPDGIFPPVREKPYFDATLRMEGFEIPVSLRVRGNSSLQECPFPKLKLKVSKEDRQGTPFFDAREVKIATHCAEGGRGTIGRLRDERAAFREALAYEALAAMGFTAPRARRARIEYVDTTPGDGSGETGWRVTREAMLFDHVEVVAERLGGRALSDEEVAALTEAGFDEQLIADLRFFHALLGNWDFGLSTDGASLWNTEVIQLADGALVPVAGDFDLASWVTGTVRVTAPRDYRPELPDVERQARYALEQISESVSGSVFAAASDRFESARAALESLIASAEIDEEGRANARLHVAAFFDALTALKR